MSAPMRKVGRGGAGNFYTQEDIQQVGQQHEDIEAQNLPTPDDASYKPPVASTTAQPLRTGRGGAGNFVTAADISETISPDNEDKSGAGLVEKTKDAMAVTKEKVMEKLHVKPSGYGGRGGAGNWRPSAEEEEKARAGREREEEESMRQRAEQDVELGLSRPQGAYLGEEKWMG